MPLMRVPYTTPLPPPTIIPSSASNLSGAVNALYEFLTGPPRINGKGREHSRPGRNALVLSGAGISVASGLADYRGKRGTYTLNQTYRPIYFHEFVANHAARQRYWARSFLGYPILDRSLPNKAHYALARLGMLGTVSRIITQNVDGFHSQAHPFIPTLELHGSLTTAVCLTCRTEYSRNAFQLDLAKLNPSWADFLAEMQASGALTTENPEERRRRGLKTNPDGDVDIPGVEYSTFRYPACPTCQANPPDGKPMELDSDGAWSPSSPSIAGVLKPNVIMFGESIPIATKTAAETAVDETTRLLVLGSSLATYSAWRLVKHARLKGIPVAVVNVGGVRGEEHFFADVPLHGSGRDGVRCSLPLEDVLPALTDRLSQHSAPLAIDRNQHHSAPWK